MTHLQETPALIKNNVTIVPTFAYIRQEYGENLNKAISKYNEKENNKNEVIKFNLLLLASPRRDCFYES